MRPPPPLSALPRFPIIGGIALLAVVVTVAWHTKRIDISPLLEGPQIRHGQVWRLVTPILPHGNAIHLIFNLYWLWAFGTLVEETFGHVKTLLIILLFAVGSAGAEYALMHGGVGLSGVNYGFFGMLWVLSRRDKRFEDAVDANTIRLLVGWFFLCIVTTVAGVMPVANIAHGVGAILGALLGFVISEPRRAVRTGSAAALALLVATSAAGAAYGRPWVNLTKARGDEWARIGTDDLTAGRTEQAVLHLRKAVQIDDQQAWAWFNLGIAYDDAGLPDESREAFEHAAQLEPANPDYAKAAGRRRRVNTTP